MSVPKPEYRICFIVSDFDCDPAEVTKRLETQPSRTWRAGDLVTPATRHRRHENGWLIQLPTSPGDRNLSEAVARLLAHLEPLAGRLDRLTFPHEREVACAVHSHQREAILGFSREVVAHIARLAARIDIDYYEFGVEDA